MQSWWMSKVAWAIVQRFFAMWIFAVPLYLCEKRHRKHLWLYSSSAWLDFSCPPHHLFLLLVFSLWLDCIQMTHNSNRNKSVTTSIPVTYCLLAWLDNKKKNPIEAAGATIACDRSNRHLMKIGYMCVRMQRGTRRGNMLGAVSWTACSTTDRSTPLSPAIRHHCSLMWTHEKHQWELNSRHCRTPLHIFQLYRTDYSKSRYFRKRFTRQSYLVEAQTSSVIEEDERWYFTLQDNGLNH